MMPPELRWIAYTFWIGLLMIRILDWIFYND